MRNFYQPTHYSVPSFSEVEAGLTQSYRNIKCLTNNEGQICGTFAQFSNCFTMRELFDEMSDKYSAFPAFGYLSDKGDTYEWMNYYEFHEIVTKFAKGLKKNGIQSGELVAVIIENSVWFAVTQWALAYYGAVIVPIDIDYEAEIIHQVLVSFKCTSLICSVETFNTIFGILCTETPKKLKKIIIASDQDGIESLQSAYQGPLSTQCGIPLFTLPEILDNLKDVDSSFPPQYANTVCALNVGQGSGGSLNPSSLSHSNLIAAAAGVSSCAYTFGRDVYMPTLSMTKAFERTMQLAILASGGCVGFVKGDLLNAMQSLRPTVVSFSGDEIPRLAESLVNSIMGSNIFKRMFYDLAFSIAAQAIEANISLPWFFKSTIIEPFKIKVGGRLKLIISSCYDLQPHIQHLLRTMLQIPVIQAYGTTETGGLICIQRISDMNVGSVGAPTASCEIRLRDFFPGRQKVHENEAGEILVKGPNVFSCYHKNKEKTKNAFVEGGWFATGDLAKILPDGTIEIEDTIWAWNKRRPQHH